MNSKFKVGDKVRINENYYSDSMTKEDVGIIVYWDSTSPLVQFDQDTGSDAWIPRDRIKSSDFKDYKSSHYLWIPLSNLELVKNKPTKPQLKPKTRTREEIILSNIKKLLKSLNSQDVV